MTERQRKCKLFRALMLGLVRLREGIAAYPQRPAAVAGGLASASPASGCAFASTMGPKAPSNWQVSSIRRRPAYLRSCGTRACFVRPGSSWARSPGLMTWTSRPMRCTGRSRNTEDGSCNEIVGRNVCGPAGARPFAMSRPGSGSVTGRRDPKPFVARGLHFVTSASGGPDHSVPSMRWRRRRRRRRWQTRPGGDSRRSVRPNRASRRRRRPREACAT
jgi:hypothetical protein